MSYSLGICDVFFLFFLMGPWRLGPDQTLPLRFIFIPFMPRSGCQSHVSIQYLRKVLVQNVDLFVIQYRM